MKKSFSTKLLALIMAVLMLATSIPFSAFAASNLPVSQSGAYLFAYFKDNLDQQKLFLALSKDGYNFEELNGGKEIPLDYSQTDSGHIRDPFVFNANENDPSNYGYYIIATDMNANNWGAQERQHSVNIWAEEDYSKGFVHLNNIDMDDRTPGSLGKLMADKFGDKECNRFWAPEVIWDPTYITDATPNGAYMMSFGFCFSDWSRGTRLYYAHTLDFKTFFDCDVLFELTQSSHANYSKLTDETKIIDNIDSDIVEFNGDYYMFFKNEGGDGFDSTNNNARVERTDCSSRVFVTKSISGKPSGPYFSDITDNETTYPYQISKGSLKFEGPAAYRIEGTNSYVVALDNFTESEGNYEFYLTGDFKNFSPLGKSDYSVTTNNKARHASVVHISDEEYDALVAKYGKWTDTQTSDATTDNINEHLVARYFVNTNPGEDVSGNGNDIGSALVPGVVNNCKTVVKDGKLAVDFSNNINGVVGDRKPTSNDMTPYKDIWVNGVEPWVVFQTFPVDDRRLISRNEGTYASIETAGLLADADIKTGVTIAFDALPQANGTLHVIDISNAKDYGYINGNNKYVRDDGQWRTDDYGNSAYEINGNDAAFQNSREVFIQMDEANKSTVREVNKGTEFTTEFSSNTSEWHTYSLTFTKGMITIYVDGVKVNQVRDDRYDEAWFNDLFKSNTVDDTTLTGHSKIGIGVSHWIADYMFTGYISNLCIYDRALSQGDIQKSNDLFKEAAQIPVNEGQVIYEDLLINKDDDGNVTESKFNYSSSDLLTDDQTNGYGQMLNIANKTIDSAEQVKDIEGVSASGYTYSLWVNPNDANDDGILMRQGSDQYHFDIKENGVVEFRYGDEVTFSTPQLFTLEPNKVQNLTIQVSPYGVYDRITAYVDGVHTGTYDAYVILENNTTTSYPNTTALKFINMSNTNASTSNLVRYGDASTSAAVTGVTIHRGAVDASDLYLEKFASLAEGLYNEVRAAYVAKMAQFDTGEHFWTNMLPAYEAYNDLNRYIDSITYGNAAPDADYLVNLVTKLKDATEAMTAYSGANGVSANAEVIYQDINGNDVVAEGASTGLLAAGKYTEQSGKVNQTPILTGTSGEELTIDVYYENAVFLYDGSETTLRMPVTAGWSRTNTSKTRYVCSVYPVVPGSVNTDPIELGTSNAQYPKAFYLGADKTEGGWYGWNQSFIYSTGGNTEVGYDRANTARVHSNASKGKNYYANILNIDTTQLAAYPDVAGNTGKIQGEYTLTWSAYGASDEHLYSFGESVKCSCGRILGIGTDTKTHNTSLDSVIIKQPRSIYVLDATPLDLDSETCPINVSDPTRPVRATVQNNLTNSEGVTGNVLAYETASALLKAVDTYTSFDQQLYDLLYYTDENGVVKSKNESPSNIYTKMSAEIESAGSNYTEAYTEAVNDFNDKSGTIDAGYKDLKAQLVDDAYLDNLTSIESQHKLNTDVTIDGTTFSADEVFTTDSAEAFKAVYDKAVDHFTSLDPRDANVQYANRDEATSNTATKLNNELKEAYSKLMPVADYQPVKTELEESYKCELGAPVDGDAVKQNYSLKSWLGLIDKQEAAASYANDAPAENALYTSVQKANQPKYVADTNGVVDRTQTSDIQNNIQNAADSLRTYITPEPDTTEHLEDPAANDYLTNYNTAQGLASRVDLEAYDESARTAIDNNLDMGYVADGKVVRAGDYTNGGVYVTYGDGVYVYTNNADTDVATKKVVEGINAATTVNPDGTAHLGGYDVRFRVYVDGVEQTDSDKQLTVYNYGDNVRFDAASYDNGSYDVINWQVTGNKNAAANENITDYKNATILKDTGFTVSRPIQQDTFVQLYLRTKVADKTKVTVVDDFGVQLEVAYVSEAPADFKVVTDEATNALKFTDVNGTEISVAPVTSANFTFKKWDKFKKSENEIIIAQVSTMKEFTEYARYTAIGGTVNAGSNYTADFNTYVDFVASIDNFFAWIKSVDGGNTWSVASYDANFTTTSVPTDENGLIYRAVTMDELTADSTYLKDAVIRSEVAKDRIPFVFGTAVSTVNVNGVDKFRLYCDYTVNTSNMSDNVRIVESGILYATGDVAPANFVKGADGVRTVAANAVSVTNSWTATTGIKDQTGYMRPYVSYMYTTTDPSDPTNTIEIPMVMYGSVVSCSPDGVISK